MSRLSSRGPHLCGNRINALVTAAVAPAIVGLMALGATATADTVLGADSTAAMSLLGVAGQTEPAQATEPPPEPTALPLYVPITMKDRVLAPVVIGPGNVHSLYLVRSWEMDGYVESVAFSHNGSALAWSGRDGITLYDLVRHRVVRQLPGHDKQTHHVEFAPGDRGQSSRGVDAGGGRMRAWDTWSGRELWSAQVAPVDWGPLFALRSDGEFLVTATCGNVKLYRVHDTGLVLVRDLGGGGGLPDISSEGVIAYFEKGVLVKHTDHEEWLHLPAPSEKCDASDVDISPNGKLVAAGAMDGVARVWHVENGDSRQEMPGHPGWVWTVAFNGESNLLATGSIDASIRLWSVETGWIMRDLPFGSQIPAALEFSEDGRFLAVAGGKIVELWGLP